MPLATQRNSFRQSASDASSRPPRGRVARTFLLSLLPLVLIPVVVFGGLAFGYVSSYGGKLVEYIPPIRLIVILVVACVLLMLILWLMLRALFRPLSSLVNTAHLFAQGNREQRSRINRADEVGELAQSFNQMADQMHELQHVLDANVGEHKDKIHTLTQFSRIASSSSNLDDLLRHSLNLIVKHLGYAYAAVYLVEDAALMGAGSWGTGEARGAQIAVLRCSTGSGEIEKRYGYRRFKSNRVRLDNPSAVDALVAQAMLLNRAQTGLFRTVEAGDGDDELGIGESRRTMALPLVETSIPLNTRGCVLGALSVLAADVRPVETAEQRATVSAGDFLSGGLRPAAANTSPATIAELQLLANTLAVAIEHFTVLPATPPSSLIAAQQTGRVQMPEEQTGAMAQQTEVQTAFPLYSSPVYSSSLLEQASHQITLAESVDDVWQILAHTLRQTSYPGAILAVEMSGQATGDSLRLVHTWTTGGAAPLGDVQAAQVALTEFRIPRHLLTAHFSTFGDLSSDPVLINDLRSATLPKDLIDLLRPLGCTSVAFIPLLVKPVSTVGSMQPGLHGLVVLGAPPSERSSSERSSSERSSRLTPTAIAPFTNLIDLAAAIIEKIQFQQFTERRLADLQTLWSINQVISVTEMAESDLTPLYQVIHDQVVKVMGDFSTFMIILHDSAANMIHVVYAVEDGKTLSLPPIPLGEGLSSIVIRTGRSLLLTDNTPEAIQALGVVAVNYGPSAKSWLGVPMVYGGETFGLIVVQDIEQTYRFDEEDERLLGTIAGQVAVVLRNANLLETSRKQAEQEKLLNEIVGKIRRSVDMETILKTTAQELSTALGAYRAHIQIAPRTEIYQSSEASSSDGSAAGTVTTTPTEVIR